MCVVFSGARLSQQTALKTLIDNSNDLTSPLITTEATRRPSIPAAAASKSKIRLEWKCQRESAFVRLLFALSFSRVYLHC